MPKRGPSFRQRRGRGVPKALRGEMLLDDYDRRQLRRRKERRIIGIGALICLVAAVIGLYIAYVLPTFLRLRQGTSFQRGPWHLGQWSMLVGTIAVIWVIFITILFMLPTASPIGFKTFNYTVVAVVAVVGFAGIYWLVSARKWFTGPRVQGTAEELAAIEHELEV